MMSSLLSSILKITKVGRVWLFSRLNLVFVPWHHDGKAKSVFRLCLILCIKFYD